MVSIIRKATPDDERVAKSILEGKTLIDGGDKLIQMAEEMGFRTIYYEGDEKVGILMPSGNVLDFDFNPRSIDSIEYGNEEELCNASVYAGIVMGHMFSNPRT